ncbi:MAG: hypothetical protein A3D65_05780 [Candidatus Lloydbacteria bacterium RIFCSPHIGHO2_02_FULL_50_13]|uniref:Uncharacterized protein n=2 Tax=Bacteria candidate phyla TaxID=1783234 RepID=A0A1G2DCQ3_9BACT|nr:MAG: hypothetical protein A3J33_03455 [candidate division WWE3 bacterium RIFCSPLOWO2_02_FULL_53_10]OGZ10568.1 MAG: hypothetical protein A3D65_05780 [Candidatus Lloydbacteria bacterium RIFCSPHIGHO2_02_FULL_50_13]
MDGILRCSRYAFGPNRLHYCGPDRNSQLYANIKEGAVDPDLTRILSQFDTMYPYLVHIAAANKIKDPLDDRVVEAYWIGNALLDRVDKQLFYRHLVEGLNLKKKLGSSFALVEEKIGQGAVPHHSFHVLDIWQRTGHIEREHTLESMDECRVSWGVVESVSGPFVSVFRDPLLYIDKKLSLGLPRPVRYARKLESDYEIEQLKQGDIVSIHWGVICERITPKQATALKKYTVRHIALANLTL